MLLEITYVGIAGNEPQQLVDYGFKMDFLGREKGESGRKVEAHLVSENALGANSCTVVLDSAFRHYPV